MFKTLLSLSVLSFVLLMADNDKPIVLHENSIEVSVEGKIFEISRDVDLRCRKVDFNGNTHWSGSYALATVPEYCKKTFITSAGKISPMKMNDDIETFGELEVLEFIEEMQDDENMLFIDARKPNWYKALTIPTAINIPFTYFTDINSPKKDLEEALNIMGVTRSADTYDFTKAKTILLFCNGIWCLQSPKMIEALTKLGYPPEKMKWYRGGLQSWLNVNFTAVKGK